MITINLTDEQQDIINANEPKILVEAVAGSGKTTTILHKIRTISNNEKVLYLAFNKSIEIELKHKGSDIKNLTIKTFHALAYKHVGYKYKDKLVNDYKVIDVLQDLGLKRNSINIRYASSILRFFNLYLNSAYRYIEDMPLSEVHFNWHSFDKKLINDLHKLFELKKDLNTSTKISHSFYLKLYQLSNPILKYDHIFVDEAQDLNGVFIDILKRQNHAKMVLVGDRFQQIYGFRMSVNALEYFHDFKAYPLSKSFRFSQEVADLARGILSIVNDKKKIKISGLNPNQKIEPVVSYPYTYLCRSNIGVFAGLIDQIKKGNKIAFEGGKRSYNFSLIWDVYNLYLGKKKYIKSPEIKLYKHWDDLLDYIEEANDRVLSTAVKVIQVYTYEIPKYMKIIKSLPDLKKKDADVIFSTVHKSKGMEYPAVRLNEDFTELIDLSKVSQTSETGKIRGQDAEEINIAYVAITRSYGKLFLNESIQGYNLYLKLNKPRHQQLKRNDLVDDIVHEELMEFEFFKKKQLEKQEEKNKDVKKAKVAIIDDEPEEIIKQPKKEKVIGKIEKPKPKKKQSNNRIRVMKNKRI